LITSSWRSPSNIALVKYWGKKGLQLPANASISFTLQNCYTETSIHLKPKTNNESFQCSVFVDGELNTAFQPKVLKFFLKVEDQFPWLHEYTLEIHTSNTFPHSSGIASSASAFSALALCLADIHKQIHPQSEGLTINQISSIARLGSGSACRSVQGGMMVWGEHKDYQNSNDLFAVKHDEVDPIFTTYQDAILLVHKGEKTVSSTLGHSLIDNHPFAAERFAKADSNMLRLKNILREGDTKNFAELVESEALMLHAMMMTSDPNFILMKPNTLSIIEEIRSFREQTSIPACFTLDAGANVHLLYPEKFKPEVEDLIEDKLKGYCENDTYICDQVGQGPVQLNQKNA
jgi:diphosphomevalonate decarboxylase